MIWYTCLIVLGTLLFWSAVFYASSRAVYPEVEE